MSAPNSSFLKWLIGRLARSVVPVDGVPWSDPSEATQSVKTLAEGREKLQPTELDPREFPTRWANFR